MNTVGTNIFKDIFKYSISTWVCLLVGVLSVIISTRLLPPNIYGMISMFYAASNVFLYIFTFGMDGAFIRFYNEPPENNTKEQMMYKCLLTNVISLFFVGSLILLSNGNRISAFIFGVENNVVFVMLLLFVLGQIILRYFNISFRMSFKTKLYTIQNIIIGCLSRVITIVCALFICDFEFITIAITASLLFITLLFAYFQKNEYLPKDKNGYLNFSLSFSKYRDFIKFSLFSAPSYIVNFLNTYLSQQVIVKLINNFALGIYASTNMFCSILLALKGGFGTYWSAFVYKNYKIESSRIISMHDYIVFISIIFASLLIFMRDFIYLFIGSAFHESKTFYSLLLIMPILTFVQETTDKGIALSKKNQISLMAHVISIVINILFGIVGAMKFGLIGVALANSISGLLLFVICTVYGQRYYKSIKSPLRSVVGISLIIIILLFPLGIKDHVQCCFLVLCLDLCACFIYKSQLKDIYRTLKTLI